MIERQNFGTRCCVEELAAASHDPRIGLTPFDRPPRKLRTRGA
jgi:hypothetical protein